MVKAAVLESRGFAGLYVLHQLPGFAAEFLSLLGVPPDRMVSHVAAPTRYREVTYVSTCDAWSARKHAAAYHLLRDRLTEAVAARSSPHPRRIWMERLTGVNNQGRRIINAEEVFDLIAGYGFTRIDMAALPAAEQVAIASHARVLAGAHGAAFAHALMLRPGAAVIECFAPSFINPGIFDLCLINGIDYSMLVFENAYAGYSHGDDVMINLSHLQVVLQRLDRQERG
jgi:capsular polysaccharide biosynthesis protein